MMTRDEFLRALIGELEVQKGGSDAAGSFMTGKKRDSCSVFRSLCYDFPKVQPDDLQTLSSDLSSLFTEQPSRSADLMALFTLNPSFLHNVQNLSEGSGAGQESELQSTNLFPTARSDRDAAMRILVTVLMDWTKILLLTMSRPQLSRLLFEDSYFIIHNLPAPVSETLSWISLQERLAGLSMQAAVTLPRILTSADVLKSGQVLPNILTVMESLVYALGGRESCEATASAHQDSLFRHLLASTAQLDNSEAESSVSFAMSTLHHYSSLVFDLLARFPELIDDTFPKLLDCLLPSIGVRDGRGTKPSVVDALAVRSLSSFFHSMSRGSEQATRRDVHLLAFECLRKYIFQGNRLSQLVALAELQMPSTAEGMTTEFASFIADVGTVLVYPSREDTFRSTVARSLADKLTSSRWLVHGLQCQLSIAMLQRRISTDDSALPSEIKSSLSQWWEISMRSSTTLARLILLSPEVRNYTINFSTLFSAWETVLRIPGIPQRFDGGVVHVFHPLLAYAMLVALSLGPVTDAERPWIDLIPAAREAIGQLLVSAQGCIGSVQSSNVAAAADETAEVSVEDETKICRTKLPHFRQTIEAVVLFAEVASGSIFLDQVLRISTVREHVQVKDGLRAVISAIQHFLISLRIKMQQSGSGTEALAPLVERGVKLTKGLSGLLDGGVSSKAD